MEHIETNKVKQNWCFYDFCLSRQMPGYGNCFSVFLFSLVHLMTLLVS